MKFSELQVGMKVEDTWYNSEHTDNWGKGKVVAVLKTRFKVQFSNKNANHTEDGLVTYDKSHAQFIRRRTK
jgi:hypothetical protein